MTENNLPDILINYYGNNVIIVLSPGYVAGAFARSQKMKNYVEDRGLM